MDSFILIELNLRKAIWNEDVAKSIINTGLIQQAKVLEKRLKDNIDESTPAGRLYARGARTTRRTASNRYLRGKKGTKTRVITSYKVHTASEEGQPPARDTSTLYRNIKVRKVSGEYRIDAKVNAPAVDILDSPTGLNRPFFRSVIFTGNGDWDFRQAVKKLVTRIVNEDTNATRRVADAGRRQALKDMMVARKAAVRARLGTYTPPST